MTVHTSTECNLPQTPYTASLSGTLSAYTVSTQTLFVPGSVQFRYLAQFAELQRVGQESSTTAMLVDVEGTALAPVDVTPGVAWRLLQNTAELLFELYALVRGQSV